MGTPRLAPLFAGPKKAAALLDMTQAEFLSLVERGALPRPVRIGGKIERWNMRQIEAILTGEAMKDDTPEW